MHRLINSQVDKNSQKTALVFNKNAYSYQWLDDFSKAMALFLQEKDIDQFAFCTQNSPLNVVAYLASSLSGVHALAINPRLTSYELCKILTQFQPELFIIESDRVTDELQDVAYDEGICLVTVEADNPLKGKLWEAIATYSELKDNVIQKNPDETYIYHLTSGAMGHAKYCQHTSEQIFQYGINRSKDMAFQPSDVLLVNLSLNHAFAFSYQLLPGLALGLTLHLQQGFDEDRIFQAISNDGITSIALLPSMAYFLSLFASKQPSFDHKLRLPLIAGDALPSAFIKIFKNVFSIDLFQGVGMTEVFGYAQNTPENFNVNSSGKIFDSTEIEIRGDRGELLSTGEIGNVFIKNEAMLLCYHLEPELTGMDLADGWVNTGDIGYIDKDNFFYFMGRKKQIIIRGGSNVSPVEVESIFYLHPNILQAAVVGKQDSIWGQVVWAYLVLDASMSTEKDVKQFHQHCQQYLPDYKQPENICIVDELPKNATGKIDRFQLQMIANKK